MTTRVRAASQRDLLERANPTPPKRLRAALSASCGGEGPPFAGVSEATGVGSSSVHLRRNPSLELPLGSGGKHDRSAAVGSAPSSLPAASSTMLSSSRYGSHVPVASTPLYTLSSSHLPPAAHAAPATVSAASPLATPAWHKMVPTRERTRAESWVAYQLPPFQAHQWPSDGTDGALGTGTYSTVVQKWHTPSARHVAVKSIPLFSRKLNKVIINAAAGRMSSSTRAILGNVSRSLAMGHLSELSGIINRLSPLALRRTIEYGEWCTNSAVKQFSQFLEKYPFLGAVAVAENLSVRKWHSRVVLTEVSVLWHMRPHPNIIRLIGAQKGPSRSSPSALVLYELCRHDLAAVLSGRVDPPEEAEQRDECASNASWVDASFACGASSSTPMVHGIDEDPVDHNDPFAAQPEPFPACAAVAEPTAADMLLAGVSASFPTLSRATGTTSSMGSTGTTTAGSIPSSSWTGGPASALHGGLTLDNPLAMFPRRVASLVQQGASRSLAMSTDVPTKVALHNVIRTGEGMAPFSDPESDGVPSSSSLSLSSSTLLASTTALTASTASAGSLGLSSPMPAYTGSDTSPEACPHPETPTKHLGASRHQCIKYWGKLQPRTVWRWSRDALEGIRHAHACGVAHQDVKPANMFVDTEDRLVMGDWGLATRFMDCAAAASGDASCDIRNATITSVSTNVATLWWRAPELLLAPEGKCSYSYTPLIDEWALGCCLVEMVLCRPLFKPDSKDTDTTCLVRQYHKQSNEQRRRWLASRLAKHACHDELFLDVVCDLLDTDPRTRATAAEVLSYPFFQVGPECGGSACMHTGGTV